MSRPILLLSVILSAGLSLGCGAETADSGSAGYPALDLGMIAESDSGPERTDAGESIEETWARMEVMASLADLPAFGLKMNLTISLIRFTLTETPDGIISREETCGTEIRRPEVPDVLTLIPQGFIDSIPIASRSVRLQDDTVIFASAVAVNGVHLREPRTEPLPTEADDPRVFDQDQDGQPGLTVQIGGLLEGEVQLVQRTITRLNGTRSGDEMTGLLEWTAEESVLQASNDLLAMPIHTERHRDPELSFFRAKRVESNTDCASIVANAEAWFEAAD